MSSPKEDPQGKSEKMRKEQITPEKLIDVREGIFQFKSREPQ